MRESAREELALGLGPGAVRKQEKQASAHAELDTFEAIGREWLEKSGAGRGEKT